MEALPPRARLLHVGLMKTGTTALQSAASNRRSELLQHGVRYPGWHYNHRKEALALFERRSSAPRPEPDDWDRLMTEINADTSNRIFLSNEMIAAGDAIVARRFRDDLGPLTHVVFTVRSFSSVLPSLWQQYVKSGHQRDFEEFLARRIGEDSTDPPPDMARHDQGTLVARWADVFGPENVTVVVVDKSEPRRVPDSFEALLGLPAGMLYEPDLGGEWLNRSLSAHEASLLLTVNRILEPYELPPRDVERLLYKGATARMLDEGGAPDPNAQLILPPWAVEPAVARSRQYAEAIGRTGVRVIGDLEELSRPPRTDRGQWEISRSIPVEVAAQALAGALSAGMNRGSDFGPPALDEARGNPVLRRVRRLAGAVRRRLWRVASRADAMET
jgi:hypothetical protein